VDYQTITFSIDAGIENAGDTETMRLRHSLS
jgi:hypothetical protein